MIGACSTFHGDPEAISTPDGGGAGADAGPADGAGGDSSIGLQGPTGRTYVVQGAKQAIPIRVARGSLVNGAITIAISKLPAGVTAAPAILGAAANDGEIVLSAAADAPQGRVLVELAAVAEDSEHHAVSRTSSFELFVRGPSGATDTTFGTQGHIEALAAPASAAELVTMLVGPKDDIYFVASCGSGSGSSTCVTKRTPDGAIDTTFGAGGTAKRDGIGPTAALIQPDGRVVVGGTGTTKPVALLRLNLDGSPDTTFGNAAEGPGTFGIKPAVGTGYGPGHLALGADGSFAAAFSWSTGGPGHTAVGIARVGPTGAVMGSFGANGIAMWDGNAFATGSRAIAVKPSGAVLVAGVMGSTVVTSYGATQLGATGATDASFGSGGTISTSYPNANSLITTHGSVAFLDGSLLFAVANLNSGRVVKISAAGQFDNTFGTAGALEIEGSGQNLTPMAVARTADGKVLVLAAEGSLPGGATLLRMAPSGVLDASFATAGRGRVESPSGVAAGYLGAQSDGRVLVAANLDVVRVWH